MFPALESRSEPALRPMESVVVASAQWESRELLQPISADQPCGESLEDTDLLASFDTYGVFGQLTPLDTPAEPGENRVPKPAESPVWREIQGKAIDALGKSKDFRLLAHLGAALLRTEGLRPFCDVLGVAAHWIGSYWGQVYPLVDEDAMLRRNALSCLADPMAVLDGLRRVPLVSSRQHGRFSLRDVELASGAVAAGAEEGARPSDSQINAAFGELSTEDLKALHDGVSGAMTAVRDIDARMLEQGGQEAALEPLSVQLAKIARVLKAHLASRPGGIVEQETAGPQAGGAAAALGAIVSRQDAIRALDAVADYFRRNEPSSPVPLLVERAKRLVSKDFLEVLEDIAPEALAQARAVGGVRAHD